MASSQKANINRTDLSLQPNPVTPEIDVKIAQAFARLLGWDANNEIWKLLLTDVDGRLLVSTSVTQSTQANQPQVNVTTATIQLLGANSSRRLVMIQNKGTSSIYLGFGIPATVAGGFELAASGILIDDHFLGAINAIAASGTDDVRIVEM